MLESWANGEGGVMTIALETYQVRLPDLLADPIYWSDNLSFVKMDHERMYLVVFCGILRDNVRKMVFLAHNECQYRCKNVKLTQGNMAGRSLVTNVAIICSMFRNSQALCPILTSPVN